MGGRPARIVCNEQHARDRAPSLAAVGFQVADPAVSAARARALQAPTVYRRTLATEQELPAFRAPDGTEVFLGSDSGSEATWTPEFEGGRTPDTALLTGIDHVNLAEPWQCFDEAVLFYSSVLRAARGRRPGGALAPRAGAQPGRAVGLRRLRLALNVAPLTWDASSRLPAARGVLDRRRRRRRQAGGRARPGAAGDPAELLRRPRRPVRPLRGRGPGDGRARPPARPGRGGRPSRTSTPPRSVGCSSRWCSAWTATTATALPTPAYALRPRPRIADCAPGLDSTSSPLPRGTNRANRWLTILGPSEQRQEPPR